MDLTFSVRVISKFPFHYRIDGVAGCPSYVLSPASLALQLSPAALQSGEVDGSVAWHLAASPPFLAWRKGKDGEPVTLSPLIEGQLSISLHQS